MDGPIQVSPNQVVANGNLQAKVLADGQIAFTALDSGKVLFTAAMVFASAAGDATFLSVRSPPSSMPTF